MTWQGEVLIAGTAEGSVLRLDAPISFWGGIDPQAARVTLGGHPQAGQVISDRVLVVPKLIGSSSSSAVLLELLYRNAAPRAVVLGERDAILPIGAVVAAQMNWTTLPMVLLAAAPFKTNDRIAIDRTGRIERTMAEGE